MKALAGLIAVASTGCFTSWAITQAAGGERFLDERVTEQSVPQPGVDERLSVSLSLVRQYQPIVSGAPPTKPIELPFSLECSTSQYGTDRVYHSGFRYGSRWKKTAGFFFLAEALGALGFYYLDKNRDLNDPMKANDRTGFVAAAFLGLDAVGTAAIFFIPRKEVFTTEDTQKATRIREDCPVGLVLEIGGTAYPVDAVGRIGEVGEVALDDWMHTPTGTIALTLGGRALPLRVEAREQCAWLRERDPENFEAVQRACGPMPPLDLPRQTRAIISVPLGSLSIATGADSR